MTAVHALQRERWSKPCPKGCGRNCDKGSVMCRPCRRGVPVEVASPPGPPCAECGRPMRHVRTRTRCRSCIVRENWRLGKFANIARERWDRWTLEEDERLRQMAGHFYAYEIADALTREFHTTRTQHAVSIRAHVLEVYLWIDAWTQNRLCHLFNANWATVRKRWLDSGLLPSSRLTRGRGCRQGEWRVKDADLEAFIRTCPWAYDASKMQPESHRLVRLARDLQRRDPWVEGAEAMAYLGISQTAFTRWCHVGVIPCKRRSVGIQGGRGGSFVVRAADLPEALRTIRERQLAARQFIKTNLQTVMAERRMAAA